jgi:RHS repeat-associated protein
MRSFTPSVLVALACIGVALPSSATPTPQPMRISLPTGPASIQGLGRSFEPNAATGSAAYGIDITAPAGPGGLKPKLALEYDSGMGFGEAGMGWKLEGLPRIRTRTLDGLPHFDSTDSFEIVGLGPTSELVRLDERAFRPRYEAGSFVRIIRSADGVRWEARDKQGRTYRFGGAGCAEAEGEHVGSFLLCEELDLLGNKLTYQWDFALARGYLKAVTWGGTNVASQRRVELAYEPVTDVADVFSSGVHERIDRRLTTISVLASSNLVRRYRLTYQVGGARTRLASVEMRGTDDITALPLLSFDYSAFEPASFDRVSMTNPPGSPPTAGVAELADLDGDGVPDLLLGEAGKYRSYINDGRGGWSEPTDWGPLTSPSYSLSDAGAQLADADGDGSLDLLARRGNGETVVLPGATATSFGEAFAVAAPSMPLDDPNVQLADMDGDRRADLLVSTDTGLSVAYFALGQGFGALTPLPSPDASTRFSFADHSAELCDVNGDGLSDLCSLRSGSLRYWLGLGRGRFQDREQGANMPDFSDEDPFVLRDLDGDGFVDLVHVGATFVSYRLAERPGVFGAEAKIEGVPSRAGATVVRFADMNGSGTTDIVWVTPRATGELDWTYVELFPQGKPGLLRTIDNGLGRVTSIEYASVASQAARMPRAASSPRLNVAMPVVASVSESDGTGLPAILRSYVYSGGAWDALEHTFAGFARTAVTEVGDERTPDLVSVFDFDQGLTARERRGSPLLISKRDGTGAELSRTHYEYERLQIAGTAAQGVSYSYRAVEEETHAEGRPETEWLVTRKEWVCDEFGNAIDERIWGVVDSASEEHVADARHTVRSFADDDSDWVLGHLVFEEVRDGHEQRLAARRLYYDGPAFEGLPLGQLTHGLVSREEAWVGPADDTWQTTSSQRFDEQGNPVETRDGAGGARIFTWDAADASRLVSESVLVGGAVGQLTELAEIDPGSGNLLSAVGYDGQKTTFRYDALGRLTGVVHVGDDPDKPSVTYQYIHSRPLSRVITKKLVWADRQEYEQTEELFDGLGRKRGALTRVDDGRWVLTAVRQLDARGQVWLDAEPQWVGDADHDSPLPALLAAASGVESWRDSLGRVVKQRAASGSEEQWQYLPLASLHWNAAQSDLQSGYEHTPIRFDVDGFGRTTRRTETLDGREVSSRFTYDALGNLLSRTDPDQAVSTYTYDGLSRRVSVEDADSGHQELAYDGANDLVSLQRADGKTHRLSYDPAGRVLTEDWDGDGFAEVENHWDSDPAQPNDVTFRGKLVSVRDPSGLIENQYDARGRVTLTRHHIDGATYVVKSEYDAQDRECVHVYPDGTSIEIRRNTRGQLAGYAGIVDLEYDADGLELTRSFDSGVVQRRSYNVDRQLTQLRVSGKGGDEVVDLTWDYDGAGLIVGQHDLRPGVAASLDRSEQYTYDNLFRLRRASGSWGEMSWQYSDSGRLLSRAGPSGRPDLNFTYEMQPFHAPVAMNERTFTYDARGRMQSDGERQYTWNDNDQLTRVQMRGGSVVESTFDVNGERRARHEHDRAGRTRVTHFVDDWSEVIDGTLTNYVVHSGQRIVRLEPRIPSLSSSAAAPPASSSQQLPALIAAAFALLALLFACARRRWLIPVLATALVACGGSHAQHAPPKIVDLGRGDALLFYDALGSLIEETDRDGAVQASSAALPFGSTRYDTSHETRKYAGAARDSLVGLDQMGARFYAPDLGIWTSPDPASIEEPARAISSPFAAANPFAYAALSPVVAKDADGHWVHIAIGAAIGAAVSGGVEAYHQYQEHGHIDDWGRVGAKAAAGAVIGAVTALAGPEAGLAAHVGLGAATGAGGGLAERLIDSKGQNAGTVKDVVRDTIVGGITGGLGYGASKLLQNAGGALKRALCACSVCFAPDTLVETDHGRVPIAEVEVGDHVLARSDITGEFAWQPVLHVFANGGADSLHLEIGEGDNSEQIAVTPEHELWVESRGWTPAIDVVTGDTLIDDRGRGVTVRSTSQGISLPATYNLEVAGSHTYFVGSTGIWVHNACVLSALAGEGGGGGGGARKLYRLITDAADSPSDNFVSNAAKGLPARGAEIGNPAIHNGISTFDTIEGATSRISLIEKSGRVKVLGIGELSIPEGSGVGLKQTLGPGHYTVTGAPADIASLWGVTWLK